MKITLSIDDQVVAKARRIAAVRGTSLNQLIRDYLEDLTRQTFMVQCRPTPKA